MATPRFIVNNGLGTDSTAMLMRFIHEPATRPCALEDMLVITAMTGDEFPETGQMVSEHVLPLFRSHGVRYVQVARGGLVNADGIVVLDDSTAPERMHMRGPVALSDEMGIAGTIPQYGGTRKCSLKWKGWVIDTFLARELAGPYVQLMGFEAGETGRATDDASYNTGCRTGRYPLIDWGWDRRACDAYIFAQAGVRWPKSCCVFCPFALCNRKGRDRTLDRYAANPEAALPALMLEYTARALNPRQGLASGTSLTALLAADPRQEKLLRMFEDRLDAADWRLYEVQRAILGVRARPRSLRAVAGGSRAEMAAALRAAAAGGPGELDAHDGIERLWRIRRGPGYPAAEHLLAAAPAGVADKVGRGFAAGWERALAGRSEALF
jgi:hypothetical protein